MTWVLVTRTRAGVTDYAIEWIGTDYASGDIAAVCPTREAAQAALRLIDGAASAGPRKGTAFGFRVVATGRKGQSK